MSSFSSLLDWSNVASVRDGGFYSGTTMDSKPGVSMSFRSICETTLGYPGYLPK